MHPKVQVTADGAGVVGHAGARLLADVTELTAARSANCPTVCGIQHWTRTGRSVPVLTSSS
ncbi:hypothetical protein [Streptomyces sp. NPDC004286]|uniref:hypothetical protein n=1 Tax=Streptomyces sp. NPDC004286 TaxID=3364696 RepID=UPI0036A380A4